LFSGIKYADLLLKNGRQGRVFGVSAIANHQPFESYLKDSYTLVAAKHYPDHHPFTLQDAHSIYHLAKSKEADYVICTSKDYVKLKSLWVEFQDLPLIAQPIEPEMNEADTLSLQEMISKLPKN
jgi:tetraacyldisaccharide-1-P 4'-kinase